MIIFHTIPIYDQIIYMTSTGQIPLKRIELFTLFGMKQQGVILNLYPKEEYISREYILEESESNFDYYFWKQIESDPQSFAEKMKLIKPEMEDGYNTLLLVQTEDTPYRMAITESIIGYLKMFYGIMPRLVTSFEDLYDPSFMDYNGFSYSGICKATNEMLMLEG